MYNTGAKIDIRVEKRPMMSCADRLVGTENITGKEIYSD